MKGLAHNDWNNTEVFFRGSGDIIGASKIDEEILIEIQKEEERALEIAVEQASMIAEDAMESDNDGSGDLDQMELADAMQGVLGNVMPQKIPEHAIDTHDLDNSGTLDQYEVENAILQSNEPKEWKFDQFEESD